MDVIWLNYSSMLFAALVIIYLHCSCDYVQGERIELKNCFIIQLIPGILNNLFRAYIPTKLLTYLIYSQLVYSSVSVFPFRTALPLLGYVSIKADSSL